MTKVLLIDQETNTRIYLRASFELHGFTVIEAENAAAGLRAATMERTGSDHSRPQPARSGRLRGS